MRTEVDDAIDFELGASEDGDREDRELKSTLEQKSKICLMLLTLLPEANAFQGIIGDPEDWVQDIITNMVKKTTRRVTDDIMNTASSSLHGLISNNCKNLFPSLGLLIFYSSLFLLEWVHDCT